MNRNLRRWSVSLVLFLTLGCGEEFLPPTAVAPSVEVGSLKVVFVDAHIGTILRTPAGKTVVIDPGESEDAKYRIAPMLKSEGVDTIDAIVFSHPHIDHYEGAPYLLWNFKVKVVVDSGFPESGYEARVLSLVLPSGPKNKLPYDTARVTGLHWGSPALDWDPALTVEVLGPRDPFFTREEAKERNGYDTWYNWVNENSLILLVTHGDVRFLFTGDIRKLAMDSLLTGERLAKVKGATVVGIPHHGKDREYAKFADTVGAKVAVGSNEAEWGTIQTWRKSKAFTYQGDVDGHVSIVSDGAGITVTTSKSGRKDQYQP